ncbi:MAG: SGNH/GDSL hydrolase family protein [Gammaproteobacteria bacterium]|nr:SGNH/GDSL hydrolase family protein [Gammaproteobacteria bacterium]MCP5138008.1 SGNH/GDSL hydrolase family protein [Gammaproteobacteria bacterium]
MSDAHPPKNQSSSWRDWVLLGVVLGVSIAGVLLGLRWFAPHLLGVPTDLQLVQTSEAVPPFYEGVFRREDVASKDFLLKDPRTVVRAHPLIPESVALGPNDILGFRNRDIPNVADVVVLGDSQTYGNNARLEENWPSRLQQRLGAKHARVYSMATGGWGGIQYLDMFDNATLLRPRTVVVAFYSGNDALEAFRTAYGVERWRSLRLSPALSTSDLPKIEFPAPKSSYWTVEFEAGNTQIFTPELRLGANQDIPAVDTGYRILEEVGRNIANGAARVHIPIILTVIPTKELVYARRVEQAGVQAPPEYQELVARETQSLEKLAQAFRALPGVSYVDVLGAMQAAAMQSHPLYYPDPDGHPSPVGYGVIAEALFSAVDALVPPPPRGMVVVRELDGQTRIYWVDADGKRLVVRRETLIDNGWEIGEIPKVMPRDIAKLPYRGYFTEVDAARYGPQTVR